MSGHSHAPPGAAGAPRTGAGATPPADARPPGAAPPAGPPPPQVAASRLVATLAGFGAIAGLLIVLVYQWTHPRIEAHRAAVLQGAIREVLAEPDRTTTLFVYRGRLVEKLPAGVDSAGLDRVYLGLDQAGRPVGFALTAAEPGFSDVITLIFGYDPRTGRVLGMKVLDSRETPGLGDRIEKDSTFGAGFAGALAPLVGVKRGAGTGDRHQVDMITGATISSRAVIGIINHRLERVAPLLASYPAGVRP